jgi:glycerol kinase
LRDHIAAIDQGTTSTRFIVFDGKGSIVSAAQKEHEQLYPQPGWVEHDPEEIWQRTQEVIHEAMAQRSLRPKDLAAIGITNQRETSLLWDRSTGKPVSTNRGHLARAALEATAYQTRDVAEAMEQDSRIRLNILRADGGMVTNNLLMQFQADVLNRPVVRPIIQETTALGAAYAAGLAVGFYQSLDDLRSRWAVDRRWELRMGEETREALYRGWKKAVTPTFNWVDT